MSGIPCGCMPPDNTTYLKVLKDDQSIVSISKVIMDVNKKCLFNRWVPPSVTTNDDLYVIDGKYYPSHYTVCAQKDIVKSDNYMQIYNSIQELLIKEMHFNKLDLQYNKAFNLYESSSSKIYECRILYAYYINSSVLVDNIRWRCYIDQTNTNIVMTTFLLKKCLFSSYSNYIIQFNIGHCLKTSIQNHKNSKFSSQKDHDF